MTTVKTPVLRNRAVRMYGVLNFRRNEQDAKEKHCHVVYRLFVSTGHQAFKEVHNLTWDTEEGEIAGLDLIGFSPDGNKTAANFWLAEGDSTENRPIIYDLKTGGFVFRSLEDKLSVRIHRDCDQYYEALDAVTDDGRIMINVPPIQNCPDAGLWSFDPKTAVLKRVRKSSGQKRID